MSLDKRKYKRHALFLYLEVVDAESQQLLGRIGDLSYEGGFRLLTEKELKLEEFKNVIIKIPATLRMTESMVKVNISPRWSKIEQKPGLFAVGCQFNNLSHSDKIILYRLISTLGFSGIAYN